MTNNTAINSGLSAHIYGESFPIGFRFTLKSTRIYQSIAIFIKKWTGLIGKTLFLILFSPLFIVGYFVAKRAYFKLDKLVERYKTDFEAQVNSWELKKIKEEELELSKIQAFIESIVKDLESNSRIITPFSERVISINNNLKYLTELCQSRYKYSKDEFFSSDAEYEAFRNAFADLDDIWNYETTDEEQEFVFASRKKPSK